MERSMKDKRMLVVAAHPGDVLWRCSGAIAKHVKLGGTVNVIVLTYGTGGEANELFKAGMNTKEAKDLRKKDLTKAAGILGIASLEFWDMPDYRFEITQDKIYKLAQYMRQNPPDLILTHHGTDYFNPDHGTVLSLVNISLEVATGHGVRIPEAENAIGRAPIFCFEPHASEINGFNPNLFVDITDVMDLKIAAMATFELKKSLAASYVDRAKYRAVNAGSFGRKGCQYAEAYQAVYPVAQDGYFVY
ncbi:PIG-L deacetylase family protein [Enterocloster asparagiformis]|uniref:PIG-L deacetylase family protein n=1 Tax=Enterocloster asparagiformis TaxID=333367 RepID=UPI002A801B24|nr:PIG-L deacetylase family protein [Enterocloster asparagiformis]